MYQQSFLNRDSFLNQAFLNQDSTVQSQTTITFYVWFKFLWNRRQFILSCSSYIFTKYEIRIPNISMNFSTDQNVYFSFFKWFKNAQSSQTLLYSYYSKTINILAALYLSIHGPWVLTDIIMEKFLQNPLKGFIPNW